jgi:hypothetical protein
MPLIETKGAPTAREAHNATMLAVWRAQRADPAKPWLREHIPGDRYVVDWMQGELASTEPLPGDSAAIRWDLRQVRMKQDLVRFRRTHLGVVEGLIAAFKFQPELAELSLVELQELLAAVIAEAENKAETPDGGAR